MEDLTIKDLQSLIFNLNMMRRRYVWDAEHKSAEICNEKIDRYTKQLKELQDG